MEDKTLLPALAEQSKQFEEIKSMFNKIAQLPRPTESNPNENPMYIDFRKIDAFLALENAYYQMFAQQKVSLEYVPFAIISKSIKWVEKSYKKDLKKQVNKKYKNLIKKEKRAKRALAIKRFFKQLFSILLAPFKLVYNGLKYLLKKVISKRKKKSDSKKTIVETNTSPIDSATDEATTSPVDNDHQS